MDMILFGPGVYITIATYEMNATKSNIESPPGLWSFGKLLGI
jgi:hypothetical protein